MARYVDTHLAEGERIVHRSRQHWLALLADTSWLGALTFVAVVAFLLGRLVDWSALDWLALFALLGLLARLGWRMVAWRAEDDVVTDRRVIKVEGVLNRVVAESALRRVDDAVLRQGVVGRLLGYGDLVLVTGPDASVDEFRMLDDPAAFKRAMLEAKYASERDITPPTPGPALRVPVGAGSVPARAMSPVEIATTLAGLADLRDRGVISPADYDAKKADLLRRM